MANIRPAGLSDEDTDNEDDYGYDHIKVHRTQFFVDDDKNARQILERDFQEHIRSGSIQAVAHIVRTDLKNEVNTVLYSGWTPLLHACFHAQEEIVKYFLDIDADTNAHADSLTPVMMICANSAASETTVYNIVSKLIEHDCILNIGDKYGVTPLMKAVLTGRTSVVKLILDNGANIEMRDSQGWTAVFYAIHHNQAECLEILLSRGARLNIVDMANRSPRLVAYSHNNQEICRLLTKYSNIPDDDTDEDDNKDICNDMNNICEWQEYYPGLRDENRPKYFYEINNLLYGMNCDHLRQLFAKTPMDLRKFLLLEDEDMIKLGVDMPFERQRLKQGLRAFHAYWWKVGSVAGLQTERGNNYRDWEESESEYGNTLKVTNKQDGASLKLPGIIKCVNVLGNHLQQLYILEATLTYALRGYNRVQNKMKFEPPDSPTLEKLQNAVTKMTANINSIRREINIMKKIHIRISKDSVKPVDLITEKTTKEIAVDIFTKIVVISSVCYLLYRGKGLIPNMFNK